MPRRGGGGAGKASSGAPPARARAECPVCLHKRALVPGLYGCAHKLCRRCATEWNRNKPAVEHSCPLCRRTPGAPDTWGQLRDRLGMTKRCEFLIRLWGDDADIQIAVAANGAESVEVVHEGKDPVELTATQRNRVRSWARQLMRTKRFLVINPRTAYLDDVVRVPEDIDEMMLRGYKSEPMPVGMFIAMVVQRNLRNR